MELVVGVTADLGEPKTPLFALVGETHGHKTMIDQHADVIKSAELQCLASE